MVMISSRLTGMASTHKVENDWALQAEYGEMGIDFRLGA
jgi:hypothetical protein